MELVTGFRGKNHVTAAQIARLIAATVGDGTFVLKTQDELAAEVLSANKISVATGDLVLDGLLATNEAPEELTIENGATGFNRNDLIIARYTKAEPAVDEDGNPDYTMPRIEDCNLAIVKGTPSTGDPVDPEIVESSLSDSNTSLAERKIYRVPIRGLTVEEPQLLIKKFTPASDYRDSQSQQGDTGIWHWVKYENGWVECWGTDKNTHVTVSGGNTVTIAAPELPFEFAEIRKYSYEAQNATLRFVATNPLLNPSYPGRFFISFLTNATNGSYIFDVFYNVAGFLK